jgi:hypothetical protein
MACEIAKQAVLSLRTQLLAETMFAKQPQIPASLVHQAMRGILQWI